MNPDQLKVASRLRKVVSSMEKSPLSGPVINFIFPVVKTLFAIVCLGQPLPPRWDQFCTLSCFLIIISFFAFLCSYSWFGSWSFFTSFGWFKVLFSDGPDSVLDPVPSIPHLLQLLLPLKLKTTLPVTKQRQQFWEKRSGNLSLKNVSLKSLELETSPNFRN